MTEHTEFSKVWVIIGMGQVEILFRIIGFPISRWNGHVGRFQILELFVAKTERRQRGGPQRKVITENDL